MVGVDAAVELAALEVPVSSQLPLQPVAGPVVEVAPVGTVFSDGGTAEFSSLELAVRSVADGGTVRVHDGVYQGPMAWGALRAPVNVVAVGNGAIIDCAQRLSGWQLVSGSIYETTTAAPVSAVFVDGGVLARARFPATGFATIDASDTSSSKFVRVALTPADRAFFATRSLDQALVTVRVVDWQWNTATVAGVDGGALVLGKTSTPLDHECTNDSCDLTYPALAGWGYYLENEAWMLTQPGGWAYDAKTQRLRVWLPDSSDPNLGQVSASTFTDCVTVGAATDFSVSGLTIEHSGHDGLVAESSYRLRLHRLTIRDTKHIGLIISNSDPFILDDSRVVNTGSSCVQHGVPDDLSTSLASVVEANVFERCGLLGSPKVAGAAFNTWPSRATQLVYRHNLFRHNATVGVWLAAGSTFEQNTLVDHCLVIDDCGAIYASGYMPGQLISDNLITGVQAFLEGKGRPAYPANGIYLDDFAHGVTVQNNRIADVDFGLFLHNTFDTELTHNLVVNSRRAHLAMQEDSVRKVYNLGTQAFDPVLDGGSQQPSMGNNVVHGNQWVDGPTTVALQHDSYLRNDLAGLRAAFQGEDNAYWAPFSSTVLKATSGVREWADLQRLAIDTPAVAALRVSDAFTVTAEQTPLFALSSSTATSFSGYTAGVAATPKVVSCPTASASGSCVQLDATDAGALLISPTFASLAGQLYRVTVQAQLDQGEPARLVGVLREGGPTYDDLNTLPGELGLRATSTEWVSRNFFVFSRASVPRARFDLAVPAQHTALLGALTVTPVTGLPVAGESRIFTQVNPSFFVALDAGCPTTGCTGWFELDGGVARQPMGVPPRQVGVWWHP